LILVGTRRGGRKVFEEFVQEGDESNLRFPPQSAARLQVWSDPREGRQQISLEWLFAFEMLECELSKCEIVFCDEIERVPFEPVVKDI